MTINSSLITCETLKGSLGHVQVFEASWFMGDNLERSQGYERYCTSHIAGAVFFNIDEIADKQQALPHMLPSLGAFRLWAAGVGIQRDRPIVVYDRHKTLMSAPRAWWLLRCFGYNNVAVLDGGFNAWLENDFEVERGNGRNTFLPPQEGAHISEAFASNERARYCASLTDVRAARQAGTPQIIDARGQARFQGQEQEPRAGLACGHIPTSLNVPFTCVCDDNGRMLPETELRDVFDSRGVDVSKPAMTSCGSGITACVLAFALHRLSNEQVRVYDGSWAEWGSVCAQDVMTS